MADSAWLILLYLAPTLSWIAVGILGFRAVFKFLEWQDGNKDMLWNFLALCCGAAASVFFAIGTTALWVGPESAFEIGIYMGSILALAAIALTFVSVLLKWLNFEKA